MDVNSIRSSTMSPLSGSTSYLFLDPVGISTKTVTSIAVTTLAQSPAGASGETWPCSRVLG
jgi:hypothetical protein